MSLPPAVAPLAVPISCPRSKAPTESPLEFRSCSGAAACRSCLHDRRFLGGAFFGDALGEDLAGLPVIRVPVAILQGDPTEGECWLGEAEAESGLTTSGIRYRHDGSFLFGMIRLREADFVGRRESGLQRATEAAYRAVFEAMDALAYPNLVRCWNYLADINGDLEGLERYRHFNIGRQDAFLAASRETVGGVPAACALGTRDSDLLICFLASRRESIPVENPRQVSAYRYPQDYGPRAPTFARAAIVPLDGAALLLVSGTASIVGHQTVHAGDLRAQFRESMANIRAVVVEANRCSGDAKFELAGLDYRIYLRRSDDLDAARDEFAAVFAAGSSTAAGPHVVFMQADVCRQDLLVEVEASGYAAI